METDPIQAENSKNSSSSSDDEEDDAQEQAWLKQAEELEQQLSTNKYLYDVHIELVKLYKNLGDLTSLRATYQRFHDTFPLTTNLWLAWMEDEMKLATTPQEKRAILKLFDSAVEDYQSVKLWSEYALYSLSFNEPNLTHEILERGLRDVGLHTSEGSLLWDTLREYVHGNIALHEPESEKWKALVQQLIDVFKRQLSVPLLGMENTYNEWQEWSSTLPPDLVDLKSVDWGYKKAFKTLQVIKPFEDKLLAASSDEEFYAIYTEYISSLTDPSAVRCTYERAIAKLCLNPSLWLNYCTYAFKLGEAALTISLRSLRNCPWSEDLWVVRLRILENLGKNGQEVLECFEQGVSSISPLPGLELWTAYLEYFHRTFKSDPKKLDKLFEQATSQLDAPAKLQKWHARLLAERGDMVAARKVWGTLLQHAHNKSSSVVWLEYANLERQYGEAKQLRAIFQRALTTSTDWPQLITEEWLMYERQFGTLDDVLKCIEKCKHVKTYTPVESQSIVANEATTNKSKKRKIEETASVSKRTKYESQAEKPELLPPKKFLEKDPHRTVFLSNLHPSVSEDDLKKLFPNALHVDLVTDRKSGKSKCFGYLHFNLEEEAMSALARDREPIDGRPMFISNCKEKTERKPVFKYTAELENKKLFVRGLPVKFGQTEVEEVFKPYGAIAVRLVVHKSGQSKGLAYVEFETEGAAKQALIKTDQMKFEEHVITVAISAPPQKKAGGGFSSSSSVDDVPFRNARSRLQIPLIPRSLQVKKDESANGSTKAVKKSNADFRNMIMNK